MSGAVKLSRFISGGHTRSNTKLLELSDILSCPLLVVLQLLQHAF